MEGERAGRERKRNSTVIYNLKTHDNRPPPPPPNLSSPPAPSSRGPAPTAIILWEKRERKGEKGKGRERDTETQSPFTLSRCSPSIQTFTINESITEGSTCTTFQNSPSLPPSRHFP
jgi:hypothetical protein